MGEITYHGRRIPLISPVRTFGLGHENPLHVCEVVALRFPGDLILGLAVDTIHEISTLTESHDTKVPMQHSNQNFIEKALITSDKGQIFAINLEELFANIDMCNLASLSVPKREPKAPVPIAIDDHGEEKIVYKKERFLVVDAGERSVVPLSDVSRIIEPPAMHTAVRRPRQGFLGYFPNDDQTVALFDLAALRGCSRKETAQDKVLLTGDAGSTFGFLVTQVVGIETSEWWEEVKSDQKEPPDPLVQLGTGKQARVLPKICLRALIERQSEEPSCDFRHSSREVEPPLLDV